MDFSSIFLAKTFTSHAAVSGLLQKHRPQFSNVNSGFRREVDENCAFLDYYAANSGNILEDVDYADDVCLVSHKYENIQRN